MYKSSCCGNASDHSAVKQFYCHGTAVTHGLSLSVYVSFILAPLYALFILAPVEGPELVNFLTKLCATISVSNNKAL